MTNRYRLIPAHAGKTPSPQGHAQTRGAHPRSRGENPSAKSAAAAGWGSSPLTRGKRAGQHVLQWPARLIPAHAGKTRPRRDARQRSQAHPRSRGENVDGGGAARPVTGSSPLTRGKLMLTLSTSIRARLIPAHAGKTDPEHPRASTA